MNKSLPPFLPARVGEFRAMNEVIIRITPEMCVMDLDMERLRQAVPIERDVRVYLESKRKVFTRLKLRDKSYLADRVTGTLYNEKTGRTSSPGLQLLP